MSAKPVISKKLKNIFFVSLVLIYSHGIEEVFTEFPNKDSFMVVGAGFFATTPEVFYWVSHIIWWIMVPLLFFIFEKSPFLRYLMALYGFVFITELHHLVKGILTQSYYPGMITALLYPLIGFFYWKQLLRDWRNYEKA